MVETERTSRVSKVNKNYPLKTMNIHTPFHGTFSTELFRYLGLVKLLDGGPDWKGCMAEICLTMEKRLSQYLYNNFVFPVVYLYLNCICKSHIWVYLSHNTKLSFYPYYLHSSGLIVIFCRLTPRCNTIGHMRRVENDNVNCIHRKKNSVYIDEIAARSFLCDHSEYYSSLINT